jgi:hypothetical protein
MGNLLQRTVQLILSPKTASLHQRTAPSMERFALIPSPESTGLSHESEAAIRGDVRGIGLAARGVSSVVPERMYTDA